MKYYFLTNTIDTKVIGHYPQSEDIKTLGTIGQIDPNSSIGNLKEPPIPILHSRTIQTSYLDVVAISKVRFLVIDDGLLKVLKEADIPDFEAWSIPVEQQENVLDGYNLFHIIEPKNEVISFKNSDFYTGKYGNWRFQGKELEIENFKEFREMAEHLSATDLYIKANTIVINLEGLDIDIFRLDHVPIGKGHFVSERLKKEIENNGLTGMEFVPIEEFHKKIKIIFSEI